MSKKTFYLKIGIVLVLSYWTANLLVKEVFIANTPRIRPNLNKYLVSRLSDFIENNTQFFAGILNFNRTPEQRLKNIPFRLVSKGIHAKSDNRASFTLIKSNEVEWVEYPVEIKGKIINFRVPKGQDPLPREVLEEMFK